MITRLRLTKVHDATDACDGEHCYWHDLDEPGPTWLVCGECGHSYRTARELRRAYRAGYPAARSWSDRWARWWALVTVRADWVAFCPLCMHDF